ncbi:hypothetical protein, partial [Streptomyces triticisoli]|uniref:hypothetical protein n=1 Tax=Streptomyces triticisoli TaxID=2182797 RepID=UPI0013009D84
AERSPGATAEQRGTAVAAARARAAGIDFGRCPDARDVPRTRSRGRAVRPSGIPARDNCGTHCGGGTGRPAART